MATFLLARHGEKEAESGPLNWALRLTPGGARDIESAAQALLAAGLRPTRIIASPFPRCVQTAALYAAALLPAPARVAIEPGLCEVLTPTHGGKGLASAPAWTPQELGAIASAAAPGVALDAAYAPLVGPGELRLEQSAAHREDVEARVRRVSAAICDGSSSGGSGSGGSEGDAAGLALYVSHGGPLRRLLDALCPSGAPFKEPDMGTVIHVAAGKVVAIVRPAPRAGP